MQLLTAVLVQAAALTRHHPHLLDYTILTSFNHMEPPRAREGNTRGPPHEKRLSSAFEGFANTLTLDQISSAALFQDLHPARTRRLGEGLLHAISSILEWHASKTEICQIITLLLPPRLSISGQAFLDYVLQAPGPYGHVNEGQSLLAS